MFTIVVSVVLITYLFLLSGLLYLLFKGNNELRRKGKLPVDFYGGLDKKIEELRSILQDHQKGIKLLDEVEKIFVGITLDKTGRADFLDNTADYKGKAVRFECDWTGKCWRKISTRRLTELELEASHGSGFFNVNVNIPDDLSIPNIQTNDHLIVTFLCHHGSLTSGNKALKIERR